jgi:hypothetical protein
MLQIDVDILLRAQMCRYAFSAKNGTMLSSSTTERNGQIGEPAFPVMVHCLINEADRLTQKELYG